MTHTIGLEAINPGRAVFDVVGASIEAPRALSGMSSALNLTGGGLVMVEYANCLPGNVGPDALRYVSRLAAMVNSGVTSVYVPLMTDYLVPTAEAFDLDATELYPSVPFSDDETFSDGSEFSQSSVLAEVHQAAALNAATVLIVVTSGGALIGGEWFSIHHTNKDKRAYRISEVADEVATNSDGYSVYTCTISPPLREAVTAGVECNFVRPECLMRLMPGTTIPFNVDPAWLQTFEMKFIEAGWAA